MRRVGLAASAVIACVAVAMYQYFNGSRWSQEERSLIASMSLSALPTLPPDPSNRVADMPQAVALGEDLFFDLRMSVDGKTGCVTCHSPDQAFQDGLSHDVGKGIGLRRTMPIRGSAYSPWLLWDGRADSQWAQALGPIENPLEHGSDRIAAVRLVAEHYAEPYADLFGLVPDIADLPARGSPLLSGVQEANWAALAQQTQTEINLTFANIGKAIAAYERTLLPERSRFDDYADALAVGAPADDILTDGELDGLALFIGEGQCVTCHRGPRLTDDAFHNTGVSGIANQPLDQGRTLAISLAKDSPFNCLGEFSDAAKEDCLELRFIRDSHDMLRAFRTPTLRAVAQRPPYMHAGQIKSLERAIMHYLIAPTAPAGYSELQRTGLQPNDIPALAEFLRSLDPIQGRIFP